MTDTSQSDERPNETWTLDRLAKYTAGQLGTSGAIEVSLGSLARKSTVAFFRAGSALHHAKAQLKAVGQYEQWLKSHGIAKTTAFEAISIFQNARNEEAVSTLSLTEARRRYAHKRSAEKAEKAEQKKQPKPRRDTAKVDGDPGTLVRLVLLAHSELEAVSQRATGAPSQDLVAIQELWAQLVTLVSKINSSMPRDRSTKDVRNPNVPSAPQAA